MGKCSRNRGERRQERNVTQGHRPQAPPRTNPLSQGIPINDFLKHVRLSDLLSGTLPPGPGPRPAGPDAAYESGYGTSRWNSLKAGLRAKILFPAPMQRLSTSGAATTPPSFGRDRCSIPGSVSRWRGPVSRSTLPMSF